jgi:GH15 family glucan-1,4-alpha-glucosidase
MSVRIEDYALIGDCVAAALVSHEGSVDWLCWPRFDSDACFAALLGTPANGRWLLGPVEPITARTRRYRTDTLILETDLETAHGAVRLIDFMPVGAQGSHVIRLVQGVRGRLGLRSELIARLGYGLVVPWVTRLEENTLCAVAGPDRLVLRSRVSLRGEHLKTIAEFPISAGETIPFVLSYSDSHSPLPPAVDAASLLASTERFWRAWTEQSTESGEYREPVRRSLITLKALTSRTTGGVVAAATASLPETLGGERNWDYRYCWLRDATFTLQALLNAGYHDEAREWRRWLLRAIAGDPAQMQIMYGVGGERRQPEWEAPWLSGYEGSQPVRFGNSAYEQRQLDAFGEVMDLLHHARCGQLAPSAAAWSVQRRLIEHLESLWDQPDHGMWEMRGAPQQFTSSKVMAWVALDRAIQSAGQFGLDGPVESWRALCERIHRDVCQLGYNKRLGAFVQSYGSDCLDAGLLLMALVGFLPPDDPRVRGTITAIERRLTVDGLVRRYESNGNARGFSKGEGAFLACSFWLADNYCLQGRLEEARQLFERLLALRNDVGLLSEEYDPRTSRLTGNFPQALSHIALVNTAHNLTRPKGPALQRSSRP